MLYNLIVHKERQIYTIRPAEIGISVSEWEQNCRLISQGLHEVMLLWSISNSNKIYISPEDWDNHFAPVVK